MRFSHEAGSVPGVGSASGGVWLAANLLSVVWYSSIMGPWYSSYNLSMLTTRVSSISGLDGSSRSSSREAPSVVGRKTRSDASSNGLKSSVAASSRTQSGSGRERMWPFSSDCGYCCLLRLDKVVAVSGSLSSSLVNWVGCFGTSPNFTQIFSGAFQTCSLCGHFRLICLSLGPSCSANFLL